MQRGAIISNCGIYRYRLWRDWAKGSICVFVMLNPSTADAVQDDPTIRRCIGFAKREGCGGLLVVNLFAFRATSPTAMRVAADPVGPENNQHLIAAGQTGTKVIAAWGAHGNFRNRGADVKTLLRPHCTLLSLGTTREGHPKHPLYVPATTELRHL